jgi:uncharacterized protein YacL
MNISSVFTRVVFSILSILFFTTFAMSTLPYGPWVNTVIGAASGFVFCLLLFSTEYLFQRVSLKAMNMTSLGLLFGYVLGQAVVLGFTGLLNIASIALWPETIALIKSSIFLFCFYSGVLLTFRAAEEIYVSIPFVKLKPTVQKKKDFLLDISILTDSRMIDLVSSGFLDSHLILPRFVMKQLYEMAESQNDAQKSKARRALEVVKKMEEISLLDLRYNETDFPEVKDIQGKLVRLARLLDAHILTADMSQIEQSSIEGVRIINIHSIAKALKPLTQSGEYIQIKVQRYGKEARQGIGYLDDGTMVVINGGAEFIGEIIKVQVLSVKHTSSGRMIFCNATDEGLPEDYQEKAFPDLEQSAKNYFAL